MTTSTYKCALNNCKLVELALTCANSVPLHFLPPEQLQCSALGLGVCFLVKEGSPANARGRQKAQGIFLFSFAKSLKGTVAPAGNSLSTLQISATALNTTAEKLTRSRTVLALGRRRRSILCCGVKRSLASAWTPHLSRVQWVFRSQQRFCSHHRAKSDQSWAMSARVENTVKRRQRG